MTEPEDRSTDPAPAEVLLRTKLHPPPNRNRRLPRVGLQEQFPHGPDVRLTVLTAPPGWGKSTALAVWLGADPAGRPFAWLSLDAADNDPRRFWSYVVAALQTVAPQVGQTAPELLRAPGASVLDTILPRLLNELAELPFRVVLVLDDYHVIRNQHIDEEMVFLVDHLPETLHVAVATRTEPAFPLPRLRARGQLAELRARDLRFTQDEAGVLLNDVLGLDLDGEEIARLHRRTEGWAAGLQLAGLSLRGRPDTKQLVAGFSGHHRHLADYLCSEVLVRQPEPLRTFLLRTSILKRFCNRLCDAVTGGSGADGALEEIERGNLFLVPLDETREWYRYHHLFGELLRHELDFREPDLVGELHRRAASWFQAEGAVPEAMEHALAAGDVARASQLVVNHWNDFVNQGLLETVDGWLRALPPEVVEADPFLCLARAGTSLTMGRREEVDQWLDAALEVPAPGPTRPGGTSVWSEGSIYRAVHRYMLGDIGRACEAAHTAVELEADGTSPWRAMASAALGRALFWSGDMPAAAAALQDAVRHSQPPHNNLSVVAALGYLGEISVQRKDLGGAEQYAARAIAMSRAQGLIEHWVTTIALVARGKVLMEFGQFGQAEEALTRALRLARRGAGALERAHSLIAFAWLRALRGDPDEARALLQEARAAVEACPDPGIVERMLVEAEGVGRGPPGPAQEVLTVREQAVLRLLPTELSLREIGAALFVSVNTIKTHTRSLYRKLGVSGRDEAVERARELGLQ